MFRCKQIWAVIFSHSEKGIVIGKWACDLHRCVNDLARRKHFPSKRVSSRRKCESSSSKPFRCGRWWSTVTIRARKDLYQWMNRRCGLVNKANPCRCQKKTGAFVRLGLVDPQQLVFSADHRQRVEQLSHQHAREVMETVDTLHERVFLDHPVQLSRGRIVDEVLGNPMLRTFFELT
jgi:hypothetical protein